MAMITSIPTVMVMRTFGAGKRVPFVFPTSPDCVVLPVFSTQEAAETFCAEAGDGTLASACLTLTELGNYLEQWIGAEPFGGVKLLAMNMSVPMTPRFRGAAMADVAAAIAHGSNTVETAIFDFFDAPVPAENGT
jgi:hypothetical protein